MAGIVAKTCTPGVQSQQWKFTRYVWWKWNLDLPIKKDVWWPHWYCLVDIVSHIVITKIVLFVEYGMMCLKLWMLTLWMSEFRSPYLVFLMIMNVCVFFSDKAQENYQMKNLSSLYWPVPATLELISYIISSMFVA